MVTSATASFWGAYNYGLEFRIVLCNCGEHHLSLDSEHPHVPIWCGQFGKRTDKTLGHTATLQPWQTISVETQRWQLHYVCLSDFSRFNYRSLSHVLSWLFFEAYRISRGSATSTSTSVTSGIFPSTQVQYCPSWRSNRVPCSWQIHPINTWLWYSGLNGWS